MQKLDSQYAGLADSYYLAALPYLEDAIKLTEFAHLAILRTDRTVFHADSNKNCGVLDRGSRGQTVSIIWVNRGEEYSLF